MKSLTVFLDSSVVLAGLASSNGGSGIILEGGRRSIYNLVVTELVMEECLKRCNKLNVDQKAVQKLIASGAVFVIETPADDFIDEFKTLVPLDANDAHVLAGAVMAGANMLVSLDKKHIVNQRVKNKLRPIKVVTPQEFWKQIRKKEY